MRGSLSVYSRGPSATCLCAADPHIFRHEFTVELMQDETGAWVADCPSIPACISQGDTRPAALADIPEAAEPCLEVRDGRGLPLTIETTQIEVTV